MLKFPEGKITFPTQKILLARKYCPVLVYTSFHSCYASDKKTQEQ